MKKLSVFIALCIILSSCTKTVDQVVKIIKEDVSVHGKKYKIPIEIELRSEKSEAGFALKKGDSTFSGVYKDIDGYFQHEGLFKTGGEIDFILRDIPGYDENEPEQTELGSAVVHIKFNKGKTTKTDISSTGTWTFGEIKGTLTSYLSEGAGVLTYKYKFPYTEDIFAVEYIFYERVDEEIKFNI